MAGSGEALRDQAVAAAAAGDGARAGSLFEQAVRAAPKNVSILNSAGAYWSKSGDPARAIAMFKQAAAADPDAIEPAINLAILLTNAGQANDAIDVLVPREPSAGSNARYWSVRGNAERAAGMKRESFASYDRAWELDPVQPARRGRARAACARDGA